MHAGSQFPGNPHSLTGLGLLPAAVIKPIAHRGGNGLALQVTVAEGDGLQAVAQGLVRQVGLKECRALAQRDGGAGLMALTGHVGHRCLDIEIEELTGGILVCRVVQGQSHNERALAVGGQRVLVELLTGVAPPPPGALIAADGVGHLRVLHGHAAIGLGHAAHADGVAGLVGLLVFVEGHLEGGALVLLHTHATPGVILFTGDREIVVARQTRCREGEIGCGRTIGVGGDRLLAHHLAIGIRQTELHRQTGRRSRFQRFLVCLPGDDRRVHGLPRAIDAAVGINVGTVIGFLIAAPVIIECQLLPG